MLKLTLIHCVALNRNNFIIHHKEANTADPYNIYNHCYRHLKISLHFPIRNALMAQASRCIYYDKLLLIHFHNIHLSVLCHINHQLLALIFKKPCHFLSSPAIAGSQLNQITSLSTQRNCSQCPFSTFHDKCLPSSLPPPPHPPAMPTRNPTQMLVALLHCSPLSLKQQK